MMIRCVVSGGSDFMRFCSIHWSKTRTASGREVMFFLHVIRKRSEVSRKSMRTLPCFPADYLKA